MQPVSSPLYLDNRASDEALLCDSTTTLLADRRGESDSTDFSWGYYFSKTGLIKNDFVFHHQFDRADLMLQAVIGGVGIGLGRTLLVEGDIEEGYLKGVGIPIRMRSSYWLVCSSSFAETERFKKLRDWLKSEVEEKSIKLG